MFEKFRVNLIFNRLLGRPDIDKAYAMVGPEDAWYDTITKVHNSLATIRQLPCKDLNITSHDGLNLKGVYYPCDSKKTMIWVHGYTSHAERESAFPALFYRSLGFNVLIPYLRAHGPSEGKYISFGAMEYLDMQRWVDKINEMIPDGQILLHGLSMGGGIVLDLASVQLKNVKCLVIDAPSDSIDGFLRGVTSYRFKKNANKAYSLMHDRFVKEFGAEPAEFDRKKTICTCRYPVLLSAGSNEKCEELFELLKNKNPCATDAIILPGCNHGNGMYKQTQLYQNAIRDFINRYMEN